MGRGLPSSASKMKGRKYGLALAVFGATLQENGNPLQAGRGGEAGTRLGLNLTTAGKQSVE